MKKPYEMWRDVTTSPGPDGLTFRSVDLALGWKRLHDWKQRDRTTPGREFGRAGVAIAAAVAICLLLAWGVGR